MYYVHRTQYTFCTHLCKQWREQKYPTRQKTYYALAAWWHCGNQLEETQPVPMGGQCCKARVAENTADRDKPDMEKLRRLGERGETG